DATFVFNNNLDGSQNYVEDFYQGQDKIDFSGINGVYQFSNLNISIDGVGDTVIGAGPVSVTLVGFTGTLIASDFEFGQVSSAAPNPNMINQIAQLTQEIATFSPTDGSATSLINQLSNDASGLLSQLAPPH